MMPDMTIWEAYEAYRIMPNLRLHQLRVAAVARELALALHADAELVIRAALLHDMGNIMKSNFDQFPPEFYGEEGFAYWEGVKADCALRYGSDEHAATAAIAREIGVGEPIVKMLGGMGFSKAPSILETGSLELQILEYADQRVAPYGIVSMEERLREGHERYKAREHSEYGENDSIFQHNCELLRELEQKLFDGLKITPEMLSEGSLAKSIESLRDYVII